MGKVKELSEQIQFADFQNYTEGQIEDMSHYPISELNLSTRAKNILVQNNCYTLGDTAALAENDLKKLNGTGDKTADEIVAAPENWARDNLAEDCCVSENSINISEKQLDAFQRLSETLKPVTLISSDQLAVIAREVEDGADLDRFLELPLKQEISKIFKHHSMRRNLEEFWENMTERGITRICDFESALDRSAPEIDAQLLVHCSLDSGIIREIDEYYLLERMTVSEYLNSGVFDTRTVQILKMRFHGERLQAIGDKFGLSRERVRQITAKQINRFPPLLEDYFAEPFQHYGFTKGEFNCLFPEASEEGFRYLSLHYKAGKIPITEACPDEYSGSWHERISGFIREAAETGVPGYNTQKEVILSVLKDNAGQPMSLDLFKTEYEKKIWRVERFRQKNGVGTKQLRFNDPKTLNNFLRSAKGVVFNCENKVRLCEADPKTVWETVDFDRYRNRVISAELIFRDYPELMAEQRIRDGNELFYVLKKSSGLWDGAFPLSFRRVPVIKVGKTSEADQAVQLLKEISPVSRSEFYAAYQQRYGVKKETAWGNPVIKSALAPYIKGRGYTFDFSISSETGRPHPDGESGPNISAGC